MVITHATLRWKMHPRNLYNQKPDFGELTTVRPTLRSYLITKSKQSMKQQHSGQQQSTTSHEKSPDPSLLTSSSVTPSSSVDQEEKEHQQQSVVASEPPSTLSTSIIEDDLVEQQSERKFAYTLDFSDPAALRELTCAVLERDFGLKVEIPLDKLIPAVPQRLNYIHWIEDLLMCCGDSEWNREGGAPENADSAGGVVGVACRSTDSTIFGGTPMEVEGAASSDSIDSTICNQEKEEDVVHSRKEGVASDRADMAIPKGDSIIGIDIGITLLSNSCSYIRASTYPSFGISKVSLLPHY